MELDSGAWEGEYLDVRGFRGELEMKLEVEGDEVRGSYEMVVADEDEAMEFAGELRGTVEEDRVFFELEPLGPAGASVESTATIESAIPYAKQALVGELGPVKALNFGGGCWMAWHFERVREGEQ